MKILIKIFAFIIFVNVNSSAAENKIFGSPSYWDSLKQVQKNFYINSNDNEKVLKSKTQKLEYKAFPEAIFKIFRY